MAEKRRDESTVSRWSDRARSGPRALREETRAPMMGAMTAEPPDRLNIADAFLDARVREGRGGRAALHTDAGAVTYAEVQALANRFGNVLAAAGVEAESRVLIALPDG